MATIDLTVVAAYFAVSLALGVWAGRGERNADDYFLGGRRQHWLLVGISILATEVSAITFVTVPGKAFTGDWTWLQLYFGSFVGRMLIVWLLLPAFYGGRVTTVYEYLGQRFGPWTRVAAALMFFASRIVGSGLRLLAAGIAISVVFDWPLSWVVVACAGVAVAYTAFGGIKAILWTDAWQAFIFLASAASIVVFVVNASPLPFVDAVEMAAASDKFRVFNLDAHWNSDQWFGALTANSLFLAAAVFGTDQDMTHRMLTCSNVRNGQKSLTFNALIGLPVVVLFLAVGSAMWVYAQSSPTTADLANESVNRICPLFIADVIPPGVGLQGFLIAGVLAAAMSSLSSTMGALSSTAVIDFYRPFIAPGRSSAHYMGAGRVFTVLFAGILTVVALSFPPDNDLLNAAFGWASLIYGSLLGVFMLGALTRSRGHDVLNAVIMFVGVGMLAAVKFVGGDQPVIAWPWWIVVGTVWTFGAGVLFRGRNHRPNPSAA
ncbi:MAG: hypothetical protein HOP29_15645 [Phycisphaerales bacterium]|nr:hypothetical protein [Phycisphaerales bacterium]